MRYKQYSINSSDIADIRKKMKALSNLRYYMRTKGYEINNKTLVAIRPLQGDTAYKLEKKLCDYGYIVQEPMFRNAVFLDMPKE